jgi:hypothetical protein
VHGANKTFMNTKQQFMLRNTIIVNINPFNANRVKSDEPKKMTMDAAVYEFDLELSTTRTSEDTSGKRVPVYELKEFYRPELKTGNFLHKPGKYSHAIRAYFCPWAPGVTWSVNLGTAADYFITPTMDGCSLAVTSGTNPMVTHANYKSTTPGKEGIASQSRTLQAIRDEQGDDTRFLLKKKDYVDTAKKEEGTNSEVTVLGFRENGSWSFYWQRREVTVVGGGKPAKIVLASPRQALNGVNGI